jgi:hypothetical protein
MNRRRLLPGARLIQPPPPDFDPSRASARSLARYGLPPPNHPLGKRFPWTRRSYVGTRLRHVDGPVHDPANPWCGAQITTSGAYIDSISAKWTLPSTAYFWGGKHGDSDVPGSWGSSWVGFGSDTIFLCAGFDMGTDVKGNPTGPIRFFERFTDSGHDIWTDEWPQPSGLGGETEYNSSVHVGDTIGVSIFWAASAQPPAYTVSMTNYTRNHDWPVVAFAEDTDLIPATIARWAVEWERQAPPSWGRVIFDECACTASQVIPRVYGGPLVVPLAPNFKSTGSVATASTTPNTIDTPYRGLNGTFSTSSGPAFGTVFISTPSCVICLDSKDASEPSWMLNPIAAPGALAGNKNQGSTGAGGTLFQPDGTG